MKKNKNNIMRIRCTPYIDYDDTVKRIYKVIIMIVIIQFFICFVLLFCLGIWVKVLYIFIGNFLSSLILIALLKTYLYFYCALFGAFKVYFFLVVVFGIGISMQKGYIQTKQYYVGILFLQAFMDLFSFYFTFASYKELKAKFMIFFRNNADSIVVQGNIYPPPPNNNDNFLL